MTNKEASPGPVYDRDSFVDRVIAPSAVPASVLAAFEEVDRAEFMYRDDRESAYTDEIVDLQKESTISQPSLVARMISLLELNGHERVLEIGTATGYQAALLSRLAPEVHTVEISPTLSYWANSNLKRLGYRNVTVHSGDGAKGLERLAPFDAIVIAAGLKDFPEALVNQLSVGGRIVAPIGELPDDSRLIVLNKMSATETSREDHGWVRFVPLFSDEGGGWTREALDDARARRRAEIDESMRLRRQQLRDGFLESYGVEDYNEMIRGIGRQVSRIVSKKLNEDQVLDLLDYFHHIYHDNKEPGEKDADKPMSDGSVPDVENT
jgi:protein-L-isoaspartate(D-aspartate) O-methyltransferase